MAKAVAANSPAIPPPPKNRGGRPRKVAAQEPIGVENVVSLEEATKATAKRAGIKAMRDMMLGYTAFLMASPEIIAEMTEDDTQSFNDIIAATHEIVLTRGTRAILYQRILDSADDSSAEG